MGRNFLPFYGNADVGSAIEDIKKVIAKIDTNNFGKDEILKLYEANAELLKAILNCEYED